MKRTSEIDEIKAALKRAAYQATHGTREERAGHFMPAKTRIAPAARASKRSKLDRRKA